VGKKFSFLSFVVGAVAALLIAACGGPSSSSSSSSSEPIPLGLEPPLTGTRADIGHAMVQAAQMAVDVINKSGGVLGHKVKLYVQDDAADPVDAIPAVHQLINVDHVVAIIGPLSLTAGAILPYVDAANIPELMWGGGAQFDHETDPHFFRMSPSDTEQAEAMVYFAYKRGWKNIALAFGASSGSQALVGPIEAAAKHLGLNIVANVVFTPGLSNYSSQIADVYKTHPQVVMGQFNNTTAGIVFGEIRQEGLLNTPWIGTNLFYTNTWFKAVGPTVASGKIYITNSSPTGGLGAPVLLSLMKKYYGYTTPPNGFEYTYDGVMTWALGADAAGSWKWPAIEKGILKATTPPGVVCTSYPSCYKLIKEGKKIKFEGSASSVTFNKYHNVFGPFSVLHFNSDGTASTVVTYSAQELESAFAGL